jgi:hypothetical protein
MSSSAVCRGVGRADGSWILGSGSGGNQERHNDNTNSVCGDSTGADVRGWLVMYTSVSTAEIIQHRMR